MKTMLRALLFIFTAFLLLPVQNLQAQTSQDQQTVSSAELKIFPVEDIRPGMKGISRTVFRGTEPEEFGVEILGVLPGFPAPRQSAIIARLSGANVERTGVFAGMSGSPVYIDGKLVGAIAFSFPFSKEPIAGITPIKQMIDIFERAEKPSVQPAGSSSEPHAVSFTQLAGTDWKQSLPKPLVSGATVLTQVSNSPQTMALVGQQLTPISTPIVFGGISNDALALFAPQLQANGLMPVSGVGGAAAITPLVPSTDKTLAPGTSVSVQLVRGDFSIAASGTVTLRDKKRIYAFGHPFLGLGSAEMPMTEASVVSVIPNVSNSFKLAVPGQLVGSISQDRSTGIYGQLGQSPTMIPVHISMTTSRERTETYNYEVANDRFLTPLLLTMTIYNTILSTERGIGEATVQLDGQIKVAGQPEIHLERRFSSNNAAVQAASSVTAPIAAMLTSGFEDVNIKGITLNITSTDRKTEAALERITLDKNEVARGETIEVQAYIRSESGKQFVQRIPVKVPSDVPVGQLLLFIGDGGALQQGMSAAQAIVPKNLTQLVETINKIKKSDRLYVKLFRLTSGAVVGNDEMPNLPPSVLATLNSDRSSGGYTPTPLSPIYEQELPPAEYVIEGQQLIGITVTR